MRVRDIIPTFPDDGLIVVRTAGGLVELEMDNRDDLVRVQLDQYKATVLLSALASALAIIVRQNEVQP